MTDRERIYNLVDKVCDLSIKAIDKITELKQENSKLKQRVAELYKPKRKFRAMTYREFCKQFNGCCKECPFDDDYNCIKKIDYPCKPYGKYILIEVKE
nr:MAG TPA: GABH AIV/GABH BLL coil heterodimer, DE NOVO.9A [Caudoviricetes sp.]